ncbi:MAG: cation:proton antiporter, partial [Mycobacteriaceae bacterium]|nr:cation:proton antiporter [Mycobacteriaceae bacterium]
MDHHVIENGLQDLLIVIGSGLLSGLVCKRLGVSLLIGHLAVGALIGPGGFGLVGSRAAGLEHLAEVGALLLLFAVGIEFSLGELVHLGRFLVVGGGLQMGLVTLPLMFIGRSFGLSWPASILAAAAGALSSTVLVFKALTEVGEQQTPHGKRAVGILLFQDVAL